MLTTVWNQFPFFISFRTNIAGAPSFLLKLFWFFALYSLQIFQKLCKLFNCSNFTQWASYNQVMWPVTQKVIKYQEETFFKTQNKGQVPLHWSWKFLKRIVLVNLLCAALPVKVQYVKHSEGCISTMLNIQVILKGMYTIMTNIFVFVVMIFSHCCIPQFVAKRILINILPFSYLDIFPL